MVFVLSCSVAEGHLEQEILLSLSPGSEDSTPGLLCLWSVVSEDRTASLLDSLGVRALICTVPLSDLLRNTYYDGRNVLFGLTRSGSHDHTHL